MKKLISKLKIITGNIEVIHRNVYGPEFFTTHEITRGYYEYLSSMTDEVAELFMSIGGIEPGLEDSIRVYPPIEVAPIKSFAAYTLIKEMFNDLMNEIDVVKETLPHDISDRLQEHKRWLRKEADYKLNRISGVSNKY